MQIKGEIEGMELASEDNYACKRLHIMNDFHKSDSCFEYTRECYKTNKYMVRQYRSLDGVNKIGATFPK